MRNINYVLTAGGLLLLSIYVKSSYKTTPKLHTSEATENLLSVRDSGAYLQHMVKGILFFIMCLSGFEDISFNKTGVFFMNKCSLFIGISMFSFPSITFTSNHSLIIVNWY